MTVQSELTGRDVPPSQPAVVDKAAAGSLPSAAVLERLGSSPSGLDPSEAARRRSAGGANTITREQTTAWQVLLRQFQSPLVYFLAAAGVLSYATGDVTDGSVIAAILLLNGLLGFSQEYRSERAVEQLSDLISHPAVVRRAGSVSTVDAADLVPGDIVLLEEGDVVPADLKLLSAQNLQADESQLTGESAAVAKSAPSGTEGGGDSSLLFTGSVIVSGQCSAVVYATGNATSLGQLAGMSRNVHKVTQYQKSLQSFSTLLMRIVGVSLVVVVIAKLLITHGSTAVAPLIVFVIALAVSVVPEALPVIATLTMARGALQLSKQHVVVKRLSSLEDLGDINLLCTDKTGTLTLGKLTVTELVSSDDELFGVLVTATGDTARAGSEGTQSAFDAAFAAYFSEQVKEEAKAWTIVAEEPFDPDARRRRVLIAKSGSDDRILVVIGAPETLLQISTTPDRQRDLEQITAEGKQGMRHLAVSYRSVEPGEGDAVLALEHDLAFLGFVALSDPLRPGIRDTLARARDLGVGVKILTGDGSDVAGYVASQVGLASTDEPVLSGTQLANLDAASLQGEAERCNVFARVSPQQKYELIGALKHRHVVGYQGDGINDAPSLKLADVGIAVDSATDVAKASADIILLQPDLAVIINGIRTGRAIFANINKYVVYTMVGNFGNFLALSVLYLMSTALPLLPRQLLLLSLLTDLPLVTIATDSVDERQLSAPSRYDARRLLSISLVLGVFTAIAEIAFFATLHGEPLRVSETSLYLFLSFTQLVVIACVRNHDWFWRATRPSWQLVTAMVLTAGLAVGLTYLRPVAHTFGFVGLSGGEIGEVFGAVAVYFVLLDILKVGYWKVIGNLEQTSGGTEHAASQPPTVAEAA